jgi:hypothetical protein
MHRLPFLVLILGGIPASFLWSVCTIRSKASILSGANKLILGVGLFFVLHLEWRARLLNLSLAAMTATTALLGMVDLIVAKIQQCKEENSEQSPRAYSCKAADDLTGNAQE